ncbi:MAG: RNA-binding transcriptional accessory protein, partial [Bdellovibrionaceae bacterium]|nr:RNA-binding transcriptional accessory protein [Pseudobdellovibrionaceae bacterium]
MSEGIQTESFEFYLSRRYPHISPQAAQAVLTLTEEGATVPFIARYRKERTGNLDEVTIRNIIDSHQTYQDILKKKSFILKEIQSQGNLTSEIRLRVEKSWDLGELEEIYRPFKKKKKTKATIAREAGLEPLAQWIWDVGHGTLPENPTMEVKAKEFLNLKANIASYDQALSGARDIIVEKLAHQVELRERVLQEFLERGSLNATRAKGYKPHSKYEMYANFSSLIKDLLLEKNSFRYLAMRRGWQEEELQLNFTANEELILGWYYEYSTTIPDSPIGAFLKECAKQALQVYVLPSIYNELHRQLKEKADRDAISVFANNVRKVLLSPPFGAKVTLGVDPGIRTGCKIALVDRSGNYLSHTVLHIDKENALEQAKELFGNVFKQLQVEAIAVGNGTHGREAENFFRKLIQELQLNIPVIMVNEAGASVYSASEVAREEFPDLDVTVRGAISIARRLQDPLSELVKIDPKSIGVGQYQHDVNQGWLKKSLHEVVESCVNLVGVDLNTASPQLLSYVSGIGPSLAKNIVEYRKNKLFEDRDELLQVPRFSQKNFEQAAGFLRIPNGKVFLDSTGIHPERYDAVRDMAKELQVSVKDLVGEGAKKLYSIKEKFAPIIGEYTFEDIVKELEKPGRDPRDPFKVFKFRDDIFQIKDLKPGMICPGIVTNVTNFGAFVDIGVHQDGLVHVSELSENFVSDPKTFLSPGDQVQVRVLGVDLEKNQISLSMILKPKNRWQQTNQTDTLPTSVEKKAKTDHHQPKLKFNKSVEQKTSSEQNKKDQHRKDKNLSKQKRAESSTNKTINHQQKNNIKPFNNPFAVL